MCSVKLTILESRCRSGIHQEGQEYLVDGICPPVCHELWQCIYPQVYALQNGGSLASQERHGDWFSMACPDNGRVLVMVRTFDDN